MQKFVFVFISSFFLLNNSFSQHLNKINNHLSWDKNIIISPDSIFLSYGIDSTLIINNSDRVVNLDSIYNKSYSSFDCLINLNGNEYPYRVSPYESYDTLNIQLNPNDTASFFIVGIDVCPICKPKYDEYLKDTLVFIFTSDSATQKTEKFLKLNSNIPLDVNDPTIINSFKLEQNYPNPFNPSTTIQYSIPTFSKVELKVFDILGREIETLVNEQKSPGQYSIQFNANNLASGVYFYRLRAGSFASTKELILMK